MLTKWILGLLCIGGMALARPAAAAEGESLPPGAKLVAIEARPTAIDLKHRLDYAQLILTGRLESGDRIDLTRMAQLEKPVEVVELSAGRLVRARADGRAELKFSLAGQSVTVPVQVTGASVDPQVSFVRDVMPAMSKIGCNQGTCHGAAQGKNGFKLSLRGYDPLYDHRALTDDLASRRFNRVAPDHSLMLQKISGAAPHVGGVLAKPGEPAYEVLRAWIAGGVKFDADAPRVKKIEVYPADPIVPLPGLMQQIAVIATYTDGSTRDVTAEAFVESGNIEITSADKRGVITTLRRGESPILVRYEGNYAATTVTVMGDRSGFVWPATAAKDFAPHNYIDELVYAKLQRVKTLPSGLCTDEEFVRRVYLDLTGLPPSVAALKAFLVDTRESRVKRDELIDRLVGSADYVEHWSNKWADLLQVNNKFLGEQGAWAMRNWIKQAVASNQPYDEFVRSILTAKGSNLDNPPASYFKILRAPDEVMENTTQLFLGVRFNCNKCHDHPFERWTQNQHWSLAAYFAKIGRKDDPKYADKKIGGTAVEQAKALAEVIFDQPGGEVKHPTTGAVQAPLFPYHHDDMAQASDTPRDQFARWATSPKNEYFAKSYVNRLWSYLLGVGFIEPVDDIRAGNPPTNPELLDRLTKEFIDSQFDVQRLIRLICKSRTYQHSIATNRWNEDDQVNYSHAIARRLPAEVLFDSVYQVTGSMRRLPGLPAGARAAEQRDQSITSDDGFLDLFGRPARQSACECERAGGVMLGQTLNLVNGPTIAEALAEPNNALAQLVASEKDNARVVEEIFLRVLSRKPTADEVQASVEALQIGDDEFEKRTAELAAYEKTLDYKQSQWEGSHGAASWTAVAVSEATSVKGAKFKLEADNTVFVEGPLDKDTYTIKIATDLRGVTGIKLEALTDDRLPAKGPGRAQNGNFVINELTLLAAKKGAPEKTEQVKLQNASADFSQMGWAVSGLIDGNAATGWAISAEFGKPHTAIAETATDVGYEGGTLLTVILGQQYTDGKHNLGKFRLSLSTSQRPLRIDGPPSEVATILAITADKRTPAQAAELKKFFRAQDGELARLTAAVTAAKNRGDARLIGAQDLVWALINSPAFLFNR